MACGKKCGTAKKHEKRLNKKEIARKIRFRAQFPLKAVLEVREEGGCPGGCPR